MIFNFKKQKKNKDNFKKDTDSIETIDTSKTPTNLKKVTYKDKIYFVYVSVDRYYDGKLVLYDEIERTTIAELAGHLKSYGDDLIDIVSNFIREYHSKNFQHEEFNSWDGVILDHCI